MTLTQTAVGFLARHEWTNPSFPFSLSDWVVDGTALALNLSGAPLRIITLTADLRHVARYQPVAPRTEMMVQTSILAVSWPVDNLHLGPAVFVEDVIQTIDDFTSGLTTIDRGPGLELVGISSETNNVVTGSTFTSVGNRGAGLYRNSVHSNGTTVTSHDFVGSITNSMADPRSTGRAGITMLNATVAGAIMDVREFYVMTGRFVTVTGMPAGGRIDVRDASLVLLATGNESGGSAQADMLDVAFPLPAVLEVYDSTPALIDSITPVGGLWGGDVYGLDVDAAPEPVPFWGDCAVGTPLAWGTCRNRGPGDAQLNLRVSGSGTFTP